MRNGRPTVMKVSLCLLLVCVLSVMFVPQRAAHLRARPGSPHGHKISRDVIEKTRGISQNQSVPLIVQLNDRVDSTFEGDVIRKSGRLRGAMLKHFNLRAIEVPAKFVDDLATRADVDFISLDQQAVAFGHVTTTTGADSVRMTTGPNTTGLDGTNIGIAILDSGIDPDHAAFLDRRNNGRVIANVDFTGEGRTDDPYGHGTHVASIAAGNGRISNAEFTGIAPNANLINLRVLNSAGTGNVSSVLNALDWVLTHRWRYNIRVVNMSLGAPAIDSYTYDPVCRAVRKLVDAGIVVVAAVGNNGVNNAGQKIYGQVHSPGNEPSALTVGAANTFGTDERSDDVVTTYSSRGPTRSSYVDDQGLKHYDHLIKPDIVAPGNKIIDAEAPDNYLVTHNPWLDAGVSESPRRRMMYMNGSSMASPMAAGAAALLLQANPTLTPNMVKMVLMYTAQPLSGYNMFEQGAGEINIEGAVRLARTIRTDLRSNLLVGLPLLSGPAPLPQSTIGGQTFNWGQSIIFKYNFGTGTDLITKYQAIYGLGV